MFAEVLGGVGDGDLFFLVVGEGSLFGRWGEDDRLLFVMAFGEGKLEHSCCWCRERRGPGGPCRLRHGMLLKVDRFGLAGA